MSNKYLGPDGLNELVRLVKRNLDEKQEKGDYAILVDGKLPMSMIPGRQSAIAEFDGIQKDEVEITAVGITQEPDQILYYEPTKIFIGAIKTQTTSEDGASTLKTTYYNVWPTSTTYNDETDADNPHPASDTIFIDKTTQITYRWSGSQLTEITSTLALGETSSTAYPGDKGKALAESVSSIETTIGGYDSRIGALVAAVAEEKTARESADSEMSEKIGAADGIVPLGEDGKIAAQYMPDEALQKQVVAFDGTVSGVTVLQGSTATPTGVVYEKTLKKFVAYVQESAMSMKRTYYANWAERKDYQDVDTDVPHTERLYVDTAGQAVYAWDGAELKRMSGSRHVTLTQDEYDALVAAGTVDAETYYNVVEDEE